MIDIINYNSFQFLSFCPTVPSQIKATKLSVSHTSISNQQSLSLKTIIDHRSFQFQRSLSIIPRQINKFIWQSFISFQSLQLIVPIIPTDKIAQRSFQSFRSGTWLEIQTTGFVCDNCTNNHLTLCGNTS